MVAVKAPHNFAMKSFIELNCLSKKLNDSNQQNLCRELFQNDNKQINPNIVYLSEYIFLLRFEKLLLILIYYPTNHPFEAISSLKGPSTELKSKPCSFFEVASSVLAWKQRHMSNMEISYLHPIQNSWKPLEIFANDCEVQNNPKHKPLLGLTPQVLQELKQNPVQTFDNLNVL